MMKNKIINLVREAGDLEDDFDHNNLIDGGYLDSFAILTLISELEQKFNIEIQIDQGNELLTILNSVDKIETMIIKSQGQ